MSAALECARRERKLNRKEEKALKRAFDHVEANAARYDVMTPEQAEAAINKETTGLVAGGILSWLFVQIASALVGWIVRKAIDHYFQNLRRSA